MSAVENDGIFITISICSVLLSLTCRGASLLLLFLPFVRLPLPVELDVVVVATKNRSGTIVTAEKQNEDGY